MPLTLIAPSDLLAVAAKSDANVSVTGTTTITAVDSTLLRLQFPAPSSGRVLVALSGLVVASSSGTGTLWGLLDADDAIVAQGVVNTGALAFDSNAAGPRWVLAVSGLVDLRWAIAPTSAAKTTTLACTSASPAPPAVMTAHRLGPA